MYKLRSILLALFSLAFLTVYSQNAPMPKREFRGAWIQIINGQFQGMSRQQMQSNLINQLNMMLSWLIRLLCIC